MRPLKSILLHKNVDCETPVSLYQKVRGQGPSFLLESVEGQENWARYSFIGLNPLALFSSTGNSVSETIRGKRIRKKVKDPFKAFEKFFYSFQYDSTEVPARFLGGAVGYLSYDMVRDFEKLPKKGKDDLKVPDSCFMIPQILLIFDNVRHTLEMVGFSTGKDEKEVRKKLEEISRGIDVVGAALRGRPQKGQPHRVAPTQLTPNWSPERFKKAVRQVKEYISAGDVTQTVLSIRFQRSFKEDPFEVYRSLRRLNPSPYMFYLDCEDLVLVGSSPETMVRLEEGQMTLRPIAGTRPRGASKAEDDRLAKELLADPKERAEHTMLVDLGRNDLGRVAAGGTVHVDEL
ncbi:MAG: chorismate-binding protein, partial [bacterium]|nr:chorismate-binding protein [bacterium]